MTWIWSKTWKEPMVVTMATKRLVSRTEGNVMYTSFCQALAPSISAASRSAEIDGASAWQKLVYITFPSVRDTSLFVAIVTTIGSFQVFDQIQVMTRGAPRPPRT